MQKQLKHIFAEFLKKMRYKYRIAITNENTLEEMWHTKLTRFNLVLFVSGFFLLTFIVITLIIFATPLRHYLPGYQDAGNRTEIVHQSIKIDSLQQQLEMHENYLEVVKNIIKGTPPTTTVKPKDSLNLQERASELMEKTEREKKFITDYEETEKYNLSAIPAAVTEKLLVFFRPVNGVVASEYDPKEGEFGISIITSPKETVKSVLEGRVIYAAYTFDNEWVIHIQHSNNFISIYKNNVRLLKNTGQFVKAGESIAITGTGDRQSSKNFYFEIWKNMTPQNPQDLITFRF